MNRIDLSAEPEKTIQATMEMTHSFHCDGTGRKTARFSLWRFQAAISI